MKTIAQQLNWNFKVNGNLIIKGENGKEIYYEDSKEFWLKREYDAQGNQTYYENSDGLIIDNRPNHHLKPCEGKAVESDDVKVIRI